MIPTISFFTSAVLLTGFMLLKHVELKNNNRFFHTFRKRADKITHIIVEIFLRRIPLIILDGTKYVIVWITDVFSSTLLHGVRFVEAKLHRFVHIVKGKRHVDVGKPSTGYLEDVKNHKKQVSKTIDQLDLEE